jgi:hypothetical protein
MGHERIGLLPKSKKWRDIVSSIAMASESEAELSSLVTRTLEAVRNRYLNIHSDKGVQAAFGFLVGLTNPPNLRKGSVAGTDLDIKSNPSPLRITAALQSWVSSYANSLEYAELAKRAAADVIGIWTERHANQLDLFTGDRTAEGIWNKASSASGFCEVSRLFFSKFTERYLRYFLEREASSQISSFLERNQFEKRLCQHLDSISQHAFDTAKIMQSFAAGWYNNHVKDAAPSDNEIETFLRLAFGKIREEILREATE